MGGALQVSALAMTGDPAGAVIHFEKAMELQPDEASVLENLERARRGLEGR